MTWNKEDQNKNDKSLLSESYTKDEFRIESQMLPHCGVQVCVGVSRWCCWSLFGWSRGRPW